jgi:hypothetical protein
VSEELLGVSLRRLRVQAMLVRAQQQSALEREVIEKLEAQLAAARQREQALAGDATSAMAHVAARLALRPIDREILLAMVAMELDPVFALTVTALAGEEPRLGLTARLLAQLLVLDGDEGLTLQLDSRHPLVANGLLESPPGALAETLRPWRAAPGVAPFFGGEQGLSVTLRRCGSWLVLDEVLELDHVEEVITRVEHALAGEDRVVIALEGAEGDGRRTVAAVAASRLGRDALALDLSRASIEPARFAEELRALRRECWLRGALPVIARLDALMQGAGRNAERQAELLHALDEATSPVVITTTAGVELPELAKRTLRMRIPAPTVPERYRMWARALAELPCDESVQPLLPQVAQRYAMAPSLVVRAAANARILAEPSPISIDHVQRGITTVIHERFGGLATHVTVAQRWEDLVLPQDTLDEILAFISRASNAALVYDDWGFRDKLGRGLGLTALFSGPPGTGKTMVAGLIAKSLGLELYQIDLSQIVSKWVGETEKQLGKVFDAARIGQAMLLFDEADALFARRTEVKSSNDRYANLEVNYLLQRIEDFSGVAILTTNLDASVDPAFKRRLAAEVHFYAPEVHERTRLWQSMLPQQTPTEGKLDYEILAERFPDMCGGHIRNAVLRAAFLAAGEGAAVSQERLARAARTEYRNMGKVL